MVPRKFLSIPAMEQFAKLQPYGLSWFAGLFELIGGALLLIGLFTRPVAFVLSGVMAFAYFIAHAPRGFYPIANGGELAALYCFGLPLSRVCGRWRLEASMRRARGA